ncbi:hypothetical protein [Rhodopirellula europaea]|uniref:hypothetical protein n=1 Tax=Rhodopirellula europaea TaxID=1263866 RepID=UPI003D2988A2
MNNTFQPTDAPMFARTIYGTPAFFLFWIIISSTSASGQVSDLTKRIQKQAAEARIQELDLKKQESISYFERKRTGYLQKWQSLEEKIELGRINRVEQQAAKVNFAERTLSESDLAKIRPGIASGNLINRLFAHINSEMGLMYGRDVTSPSKVLFEPLPEDLLKALRFDRASRNGPVSVSLIDNMPEIFDLWPYAFYVQPLEFHVNQTTQAGQKLFENNISMKEKMELEQEFRKCLFATQNAFLKHYDRATRRGMPVIQLRRVIAAEDFLVELERVVMTRAERNTDRNPDAPSYFEQYKPDQRNLATLIGYCCFNGLELKSAETGAEHHYTRLFLKAQDFALQFACMPSRESIMSPILDVDLDKKVKEASDAQLNATNQTEKK